MNFTKLRQRGITIIEILLVATIVAASIVGVFMFAKKANVSAAVETEQAQVDRVVNTIESLFATKSNFSELGSNGAAYIKDNAQQAGLQMGVDASGNPTLLTGLGGGKGTVELVATQVDFANGTTGQPNNGFALVYSGLSPAECVNLVTATAVRATRVDVGSRSSQGRSVLVADQGRITADKGAIASACRNGGAGGMTNPPVVYLSFAPSRATPATTPGATPLPACNPVRETQNTACPTGQVGTISQERLGTCSGPGNSLVYTAWNTYEETCQDDATAPPDATPDPVVDNCAETTFTRTTSCSAPQTGQIVQTRTVDSCTNTSTPWTETSNSCGPSTVATCTPSTQQQTIACPAGQGGQQVQTRSSTCPSPTTTPTWGMWETISNNCTSSCTAAGNCCTVRRETQTVIEPCPAGTYGDSGREEERFLGCVNDMTQSPSWTSWQVLTTSGACTACPATTNETAAQWVPRTTSCPAGQSGAINMEAEQVRTRSTSYSCPAGTTSLPAPAVGIWGSWTDTGNTRNVVNSCVVSTACAAGSMSGYAGWNFDETAIDNGVQYDRNDYTVDNNLLPAACGLAPSRGNYALNQNPKPWVPRCDCDASLNGQSYTYRYGEYGALEIVGTGSCQFPAKPNILMFEVQSMAEVGAGATATVKVTTDLGVTTTDVFSCASYSTSGGLSRCQSRSYDTSEGSRSLVLGKRGAGTLALFDGSYRDVNTTSGSYAACLAPPTPSCTIAGGTTFSWVVGGNSCTFTQPVATTVATNGNFTAVDSIAPTTGTANFACAPAGHTVDPSTYSSGLDTNCDAPARWPDTSQDDAVNRFCTGAPAGNSGTVSWCPSPQVEASIHVVCGGGAPVVSNTPRPGATCTGTPPPPTYNGQCNQVSRPVSWGCGEIRNVSGSWVPTPGSVMIDDSLNGGWLGNGTVGSRCVFGYTDVLDANGYPTPLTPVDAAKFVYDFISPAPSELEESFINYSDRSMVGNVAYGSMYARNAPPTIRGTRCAWTKFEMMNN